MTSRIDSMRSPPDPAALAKASAEGRERGADITLKGARVAVPAAAAAPPASRPARAAIDSFASRRADAPYSPAVANGREDAGLGGVVGFASSPTAGGGTSPARYKADYLQFKANLAEMRGDLGEAYELRAAAALRLGNFEEATELKAMGADWRAQYADGGAKAKLKSEAAEMRAAHNDFARNPRDALVFSIKSADLLSESAGLDGDPAEQRVWRIESSLLKADLAAMDGDLEGADRFQQQAAELTREGVAANLAAEPGTEPKF